MVIKRELLKAGKTKITIISLALIAIFAVTVFAVFVSANTHTADVTIVSPDPAVFACNDIVNFEVTVEHTGGDPVREIRIYDDNVVGVFTSTPPHVDFSCGAAPLGWNLVDQTATNDYCQYQADTSNDQLNLTSQTFTFSAKLTTESNYAWGVETYDVENSFLRHELPVTVDCTAPETTKHFEGPQRIDGSIEWIDGVTEVVLEAVDDVEHNSGVDATFWRNTLVPDEYCWNPELYCVSCEQTLNGGCGQFQEYTGPFPKNEESCHLLEFFSVDDVGNEEKVNTNCFFVDKTPPEIEKHINYPQFSCYDWCEIDCGYQGPGECVSSCLELNCELKTIDDVGNTQWFPLWVTNQTDINLWCEDQLPHPSDNVTIHWKTRVDEGQGFGEWVENSENSEHVTINFEENSLHELEYWCTDGVEKESRHYTELDRVDNEPPVIRKEMIGTDHVGQCPPQNPEDECFVADNGQNGVAIWVEDPNPIHAVDHVECEYELIWDSPQGPVSVDSGTFEGHQEIIFHEDSTHTLLIWCSDALGNEVHDEEVFLVDSTPPTTIKEYGDPFFSEEVCESGCSIREWINSSTPVSLWSTDEKVGVDSIFWRNQIVPDYYCEYPVQNCLPCGITEDCNPGLPFNEVPGEYAEFFKDEESCHLIEFFSVDKLGNTEEIQTNCVFVDNTPPIGFKEVGEPSVECDIEDPNGECDFYVTVNTPITLDCQDIEQPHPVDHETVHWRFSWHDGEDWSFSEWFWDEGPVEVSFREDSLHDLEFFCEDALGNTNEVDRELFFVDTQPPVIEKELVGPFHGDCLPEPNNPNSVCYIDTATVINVTAIDPEPHPVGDVSCRYWYYVYKDEAELRTLGPEGGLRVPSSGALSASLPIIQFPEESIHELHIACDDGLDNRVEDVEYFRVDKKPPITTKEYGDPFFEDEGVEWINSSTPIWLSSTDPEPHPSGVKELSYRVTLVDDAACESVQVCDGTDGSGEFNTVEDDEAHFEIPEESCHLIEFFAVDNVDKTEIVNRQCVFVDNTPPTPIKEVGEPKDIWTPGENGDPLSTFYPEETEHCWTGLEGEIECWEVTLDTPISMTCLDPEPHPVDHERVCFQVDLDGEDATEDYCNDEKINGDMEGGFCCLDRTTDDFTFLESSEHNLKFYCEDALGHKGPVDEEKFKVDGEDFKININKKWNLISTPFVLLNDNISEVFSDIEDDIESVWAFDPLGELCESEDGWCVFSPGDSPDNLLETLQPGWGYWVLANNDTMLTIGGSLLAPGRTPPSRNLLPGWNLIGYYGTDEGLVDVFDGPDGEGSDAYCALYSLTSGELGLAKWNSLFGYWELDDPSFEGYNVWDALDPGAGYWVSMKDNQVQYIYSPSTVCTGFFGGWFPV